MGIKHQKSAFISQFAPSDVVYSDLLRIECTVLNVIYIITLKLEVVKNLPRIMQKICFSQNTYLA